MPDLLRFDRVQLCLLSSLWLLLASAAAETSCDGEMLLLRGIRCASRLRPMRRNLLVAKRDFPLGDFAMFFCGENLATTLETQIEFMFGLTRRRFGSCNTEVKLLVTK